jgi:capsular polysaccharide biosynthesis protein
MQAIALFERAELVIGSHGGAMYNALWASRMAKVVEILPINDLGGYPDQGAPQSAPQWAHLAFHTNSMMNFQRYYRYYETSQHINYNMQVDKFMEWLKAVHPEFETE